MIAFFRKIRQKLVGAGSVTKYLLYAVGEILLVVIGILIALQVNNWNEERANRDLADNFLIGIKSDMERDIIQADEILNNLASVISIIQSIDPVFSDEFLHNPDEYSNLFIDPDTTYIKPIFYRGYSFRANKGSYSSLVSDGKTGLIKNRDLFEAIQTYYETFTQRLASTYESIKIREDYIVQNYPFEKRHWEYSDLKNSVNERAFLDIANFVEMRYAYGINLTNMKRELERIIQMIEQELETERN